MKPSIPKGTRDFSSTQVARRNFIFNTIKHSFELFGFQPIETPSFENSETLMGKYGEEGDRLIFKILNSGDYLKEYKNSVLLAFGLYFSKIVIPELVNNKEENKISENISNSLSFFKENFDELMRKMKLSKEIKSKDLIDDMFLSSAHYVIGKRNQIFLDLVLKYKSESDFQEVSKEDKLGIITDMSFEALGMWYSKLTQFKLTKKISEKALRYDLTVPFARYVVQYQNEITFPFKRYQIQPVWRADKPQKGRFREFFQCDADVVGSTSLWQEVEFIQLYDTVFSKLKVEGTTIKINNRKILSGIAEVIGAKDKLIDFTVALDKLDKIGKEGVVKEMLSKGISEEAIEKVQPLFDFTGDNESKLKSLASMLVASEEGTKGVEELQFVINNIKEIGLQSASLELDVTLARGLNYYTGAIFEVAAPKEVKIGSIGGGGRYDDLTGIFGLKDVSGVGISFGLDRIYLVMEELGLFETVELPKPKVLFLNFEESEALSKTKAIAVLRANGIKAELYPDVAKSNKQEKKQWKYVDKRAIEFVVTEVENDKFTLKNCQTREQKLLTINEIIKIIA